MHSTLSIIEIFKILAEQGYDNSVSGDPISGWWHNGKRLQIEAKEYCFIIDGDDLRVSIYTIESTCGIKAAVSVNH